MSAQVTAAGDADIAARYPSGVFGCDLPDDRLIDRRLSHVAHEIGHLLGAAMLAAKGDIPTDGFGIWRDEAAGQMTAAIPGYEDLDPVLRWVTNMAGVVGGHAYLCSLYRPDQLKPVERDWRTASAVQLISASLNSKHVSDSDREGVFSIAVTHHSDEMVRKFWHHGLNLRHSANLLQLIADAIDARGAASVPFEYLVRLLVDGGDYRLAA